MDPMDNANEKSEKIDQLLFVTTDSQTDLNLMSVEEIIEELNCLRKEKKQLNGKWMHEYTVTLAEKINLVDLEP